MDATNSRGASPQSSPPSSPQRKQQHQQRLPMPSQFVARKSRFDREHLDANPSEFHGFINLFLMSTVFYVLVSMTLSYRAQKTAQIAGLLQTMFQDIVVVALADGCLVLFTFSAFFLQKLVVMRIMPETVTNLLVHVLNTGLFSIAAAFIYFRDWPWVQSGSLMLHTIVLYMKMYSYSATNYQLAHSDNVERPGAKVHYPKNVTLANFVDFLLVPTLVYEPEYPRTDRVRVAYLFEKGLMCIGAMTLLYITITTYVLPILAQLANLSLIETVLDLTLPFLLCYMLVFYIVFECVCNFMAEVTCFADRSFYDDWWNSTNFDQFSRKWNKPVHEWLLRHIYLESMRTYKLSKNNATAGTFFFSMILHELALTVAGGLFRPYIMILAMMQMPLIPLMRHPLIRGTRLGNCFFWFTQIYGVPMLACLYAREHYDQPAPDLQVVLFFGGVIVITLGILGLFHLIFKPKPSREEREQAAAAAAAEPQTEGTVYATGDSGQANELAESASDEIVVDEAEPRKKRTSAARKSLTAPPAPTTPVAEHRFFTRSKSSASAQKKK